MNDRIKEQRKKMRYTQKELADKVNVSPQVISNWERGYTEPSADDINQLSEVLDCTSDYLLGRSNRPDNKKNHLLTKDERDIAKQIIEFTQNIEKSDGLSFDGEPMSEEAKESLIESMEHIFKQTQRINKKYTPEKYRKE
ncbi:MULTISPECIES: helix-turn-helix transcriptional regulator [Lysinibacillus]|uniref:helix-turn-helix domain-containing protein n=1 Tax=Lysinibacillus TaxID=400634 RepID=UPI001F5226E0|nr:MULTISPECIES: helix-turn-helix transcriptional regulator [Lysinibacillus]